MRRNQNNKKKNENSTNRFIPNSFKLISSCIKTLSSNVRSAGASVAGSISGDSDDLHKDQVSWACFDRLELGPSVVKTLLLLGYSNGFQVLDVEDASNVTELVSRRDDAVTFLQMQPIPAKCDGSEGFMDSHPLLLVVASEETRSSGQIQNGRDSSLRDNYEPRVGAVSQSPTAVRFYSLRSHSYVHVLRFRSAVYMVRCSSKIVAVGLAAQIYCFDALTLESKFSVLSYPVPQLGGQGLIGVNIGYGPMAVGPRWLAYASNNPLVSNTGRLSPQSLSPSLGVSPSTSPSNGNLVARYAMESSKQLATGLINLGDMGYKTLSKYCHELLPDGSSSPVSLTSSWKVGRTAAHSSDVDTAGTVVVKDFVSKAVVSQFRAHTSPISALCFDPSGTLLVTASIHGNNINIFRIMPSYLRNGAGTRSYDWRSSHVHLYKLHRGMTSAVIQDICFSPYSQWIAIVSSRGTGHIFVLSPFGGETGLQMQNSNLNGPTLLPVLSVPWWSTSSYTLKQSYSPPPPPPITLSVVSRIKNSGWLSTVSNAASSASGKLSAPSGVVAAVFHNSVGKSQNTTLNVNVLEHLMVYSPSGNVIQYELLPSVGGDQGESSLRNETSSLGQVQEEELKVKVGPVQWWDVCRRADWPEREEFIGGNILDSQDAADTIMDTSDYEDDGTKVNDMVKHHDQFHWYLSNAEVQMRSGSTPVWQKSQVYFYALSPLAFEGERRNLYCDGGEIEIEKLPAREIEIRRKDLLPVSDHFHRIHPEWANSRGLGNGRYLPFSSLSNEGKEKYSDDAFSYAKPVTPGSADNLDIGPPNSVTGLSNQEYRTTITSYPSFSPILNENNGAEGPGSLLKQNYISGVDTSVAPELTSTVISALEEGYVNNYTSYPNKDSPSGGNIAQEVLSSSSVVTGDVSNTSSNRSDLSMNTFEEELVHEDMRDQLNFGQYFQEGYCKSTNLDGCNESTELVTDVDSSISHCHKANYEEEVDSDDMLGGVFAFSEEG